LSRNRAVKYQKRNESATNVISFNQPKQIQTKNIELIPRTRNQEKLILALDDPKQHIVIASGPAGTGKTYLAMLAAIQSLRSNQCSRIVLTRPAIGVEGEKHGFLPGDLFSKMEPWTRPLLDVLREYYRPQDIAAMIEDQVIEISPLAFMRGRNFQDAWVIADEMQNATPEQIKMLMTRIGNDSKIVITGDIEQTDRKGEHNGLRDLCLRINNCPINGISLCKFDIKDIQRHPIIGEILKLYN
jgi:phosphate starvation-inducible PhoH-like protein